MDQAQVSAEQASVITELQGGHEQESEVRQGERLDSVAAGDEDIPASIGRAAYSLAPKPKCAVCCKLGHTADYCFRNQEGKRFRGLQQQLGYKDANGGAKGANEGAQAQGEAYQPYQASHSDDCRRSVSFPRTAVRVSGRST